MTLDAEVAVVGGGPAGLTAAIAIAQAGVETALVAAPHRIDSRTTALLSGSVRALDTLRVWPLCAAAAAPLEAIRLVDDRGGLLRAPEVLFHASEVGLGAFGHNIPNTELVSALRTVCGMVSSLSVIASNAFRLDLSEECAVLHLSDGTSIRTKLVIGADGRHSVCREAAGVRVDSWEYPQIAITCNVEHTRPHHHTSTEFHTRNGPFTLVPLPGLRSSLVWVEEPYAAKRVLALDEAAFSAEVERRAHSLLGKMTLKGERSSFPLGGSRARQLAALRVVLIGDAAHHMAPIGAQGFNLGLRDAAALAELVVEAHREGGDVGASELLQRYESLRQGDVVGRAMAVDLLNRSLLSDFLPAQAVRTFGMFLLDQVPSLRRTAIREGARLGGPEPRLMSGQPI